jgi:hypothetical protein
MSDARFVVIRTFLNAIEAELARSALDAAGIDARVHSDDAGGVHPGMWIARGVQVIVRESDVEGAEEALTARADPGADDPSI